MKLKMMVIHLFCTVMSCSCYGNKHGLVCCVCARWVVFRDSYSIMYHSLLNCYLLGGADRPKWCFICPGIFTVKQCNVFRAELSLKIIPSSTNDQ